MDDFTRECLGLVVDASLTGLRVVRELDQIAEARGYPCMIVSDNGTELTSNATLTWQDSNSCIPFLKIAFEFASEFAAIPRKIPRETDRV